MPRATVQVQYRRYSLLRLLWIEAPSVFGLLDHTRQQELHALYQPSRHVDYDEFELHLAGLARTQPSLVNKAGKRYRKLETVYLSLKARGFSPADDPATFNRALSPVLASASTSSKSRERGLRKVSSGSGRRLVVTGIARPEPDLTKLAQALVAMARAEADKK